MNVLQNYTEGEYGGTRVTPHPYARDGPGRNQDEATVRVAILLINLNRIMKDTI